MRTDKSMKGDLHEMLVASELIKKGFLVSKPLHGHAPYDLIAENPETSRLYKIQVKTIGSSSDSCFFRGLIVNGNKDGKFEDWYKNKSSRIDLFVFTYSEPNIFYVVPVEEFISAKALSIIFAPNELIPQEVSNFAKLQHENLAKIKNTERFRNAWPPIGGR